MNAVSYVHLRNPRVWFRSSFKYIPIVPATFSGESESVSAIDMASENINIGAKVQIFSFHFIFNIDETALFIKLLPRKTYIAQAESSKTSKGISA